MFFIITDELINHNWYLEYLLWCDKKSLLYSVAYATGLDAKTIPVQNCGPGNGFVGCMRKCGNTYPTEQENPLNKRSGGYFYRSIVKLTTDTLCNVDNE